jgi:hypothetical protein
MLTHGLRAGEFTAAFTGPMTAAEIQAALEKPDANRCLRADQHIGECEEAELCAHCDGSAP